MLISSIICPLLALVGFSSVCDRSGDVDTLKKSWLHLKNSLGENGPQRFGRQIFEKRSNVQICEIFNLRVLFKDYPSTKNYFKKYGKSAEEILNNKEFLRHAEFSVFKTIDLIMNSLGDQKTVKLISSRLAKLHDAEGVTVAEFLQFGKSMLMTVKQLSPNLTLKESITWSNNIVKLMQIIGDQFKLIQ